MKFEKIHVPDCTKAFECAKEYGGAIGCGIGTGAAWGGAVVAVVTVFAAWLVGTAAWGVVKALPVAFAAVGKFVVDAIRGSGHDSDGGRSSGVVDADFGGWGRRRSA